MRVRSTTNGKKQFLELRYSSRERRNLEDTFEEMGLSENETDQGFGFGVETQYYRDGKNKIYNVVQKALGSSRKIVDDVNAPIILNSRIVNIAALRVIPEEDVVKIPLNRFSSEEVVDNICHTYEDALDAILDSC